MKRTKEERLREKKRLEKRKEKILIVLGVIAAAVTLIVSAFFVVRAIVTAVQNAVTDAERIAGTWESENKRIVMTFEDGKAEIIIKETPSSGKVTYREYRINEQDKTMDIATTDGGRAVYSYRVYEDRLTIWNKEQTIELVRSDESVRHPPTEE